MSKQFKTALVLVFGVFLGISVSLTGNVLANKEEAKGLPLDQLRNFSDIFSRIKSDYVEDVEDEVLLEHAIRGMLSGLDPHSTYLSPDEYNELRIGTSGEFGGLGIQVGMEDGFVKVISPIDDTPGTDIELTVVREGEDKPLTFVVTRDIIKVKSVKNRMLDPGYGYIRISNFQSRTAPQLMEAINDLKEENKASLKGLVLDLRNNPGGVLNAAAEVSDLFINKGKLVYTEGRIDNSHYEYNAKPGDILDGAPVVVLINGGSASASEIVAGALQDHRRAIVMGSKSFGKGSVQTIQELRSGGAVKITTARYFTPNGRSIQGAGITPDIVLDKYTVTSADDDSIASIKESDLAKSVKVLATEDYQLHEALLLLKGLTILNRS